MSCTSVPSQKNCDIFFCSSNIQLFCIRSGRHKYVTHCPTHYIINNTCSIPKQHNYFALSPFRTVPGHSSPPHMPSWSCISRALVLFQRPKINFLELFKEARAVPSHCTSRCAWEQGTIHTGEEKDILPCSTFQNTSWDNNSKTLTKVVWYSVADIIKKIKHVYLHIAE